MSSRHDRPEANIEEAFGLFGGDENESEDDTAETLPPLLPPPQRTLSDRITVKISRNEHKAQSFSDESISQAVSCLRVYGIVILSNVFDQDSILKLGQAARNDFKTAEMIASQRNTELKTDWKFHELSCREENRFELRHCPTLNNSIQDLNINLCHHSGIKSILYEVCAAPGHSLSTCQAEKNSIIAGDIGVFMSQPGAKDQRLHADNDHLFWHTTLPPHVVTMFIPSFKYNHKRDETVITPSTVVDSRAEAEVFNEEDEEDKTLVGWTAFLPGTQDIKAASSALSQPLSSIEILKPKLDAGDVLLYDSRTLHYGMANDSKRTDRPLLYVSFRRNWFHDQQNWGTERLFGEE